jgi:6-phosphogluconolactonase
VIDTVTPEDKAHNTTAELVISADGKFLYVGNRGHDTVTVFAIDRGTGMLTLKENIPSGGKTPRNVRIDPTGNWFFAANEGGGNVTEFRIDHASGHLTPTGVTAAIDTPGGIYFLKAK